MRHHRHQTDRTLMSRLRRFIAFVAVSGTLLAGLTAVAAPANAAPCDTTATAPSTGDGSSSTPWVISSLANLTWVRDQIATGARDYAGEYLTLANDISANCTWDTPIGFGSPDRPFKGTFDGQGYVIRGLDITVDKTGGDGAYAGLFGLVEDAVVKNIGVTGTVSATQDLSGGGPRVGGLIGGTTGTTVVENSFATGSVNCGDASVSQQCLAGGLLGDMAGTTTASSVYATGTVTLTRGSSVSAGGLIGSAGGTVSDAYATGDIVADGTTSQNGLGGLIGVLGASSTLTRSYAVGNITSFSTSQIGALIGKLFGTVADSSYWDDDTYTASNYGIGRVGSTPSSETNANATPKTTTELKTLGTYASPAWSGKIATGYSADATTTPWGICSAANNGYPFLNALYSVSPCAPTSPTPTFDTPVATLDGFTVNVTNYDADFTWTPTVGTGSVSAGTASGSTLPLTVTGLSAGASDTITVTTVRSGYTNGSATVTGTALSNALTPTFDTPVATSSGFTVNITNYDANYTWTTTVVTGSVSAGTASGSTLPLTVTGLSAGASDTITVTTTRSGYDTGIATITGTALVARASASPSSVAFGAVAVGATSSTETVTFTSSGTANLVIGSGATSIVGGDASMFTVDTDNCSGQTLAPAATCTVLVTFTPTSTGEKSATLRLASNDPSTPTSVSLTGGEEFIPEAARFTFRFVTSQGAPCLPDATVTDTHIYRLPGDSVACTPEGTTLVGWSIPGQSWNFGPGAEVVVSGDQTFTAVAMTAKISITYDSNVAPDVSCVSPFSNLLFDNLRELTIALPRGGVASLASIAPCAPEGYELVGWTDDNTPDGSGSARESANWWLPGATLPLSWDAVTSNPVNDVHLYALWGKRPTGQSAAGVASR